MTRRERGALIAADRRGAVRDRPDARRGRRAPNAGLDLHRRRHGSRARHFAHRRLWNEPGVLATRARIRTLGIDDDLAIAGRSRASSSSSRGRPISSIDPAQESRWAKLQFDADDGQPGEPECGTAGRSSRTSWVSSSSRAILYASPDERNNLLTNAIGVISHGGRARPPERRRQGQPRAGDARVRADPVPVECARRGRRARGRSRVRDAPEAGTEPWASAF